MDKLPFDFSSIPPTWALCYDSCPQSEIPQRKTRGRHADTQRNPAILRSSPHLLSLYERTTHPHARATADIIRIFSPYGYTEELDFDNYID